LCNPNGIINLIITKSLDVLEFIARIMENREFVDRIPSYTWRASTSKSLKVAKIV